MRKEIFIVLMILFLSLINVSADTFNDNFIHSGSSSDTYNIGYTGSSTQTWAFTKVQVNNIVTLKDITFLQMTIDDGTKFSGGLDSDYNDITLTIDGDTVGSAIFGYTYNADRSKAYVQLFITSDGLDIGTKTGAKEIVFSGNTISIRCLTGSQSAYCNAISGDARYAFFEYASFSYYPATSGTEHYDIQREYTDIFNFNYTNDYGINRMQMFRSSDLKSKVLITTFGYEVKNETSLQTIPFDFINSNNTWIVTNENIYGDTQQKTLYFYDNGDEPSLFTDKTVYNASEIIAVTWLNINTIYEEQIKWGTRKPFEMHIVYYDYNTQRYEAKYQEWLLNTLEDETLYLDSSLFTPQQNYKVIITSSDGDFHKENTWLLSYDFDVIPDNEYLSLSCNAPNCYTYTNGEIDIFYKINNDSTIKIYDNDNNLVHAWYNIIGSGYKTYTIPSDINQLNTYPNWKVYLNNTGYSTSYDGELLVYYSTMVTPTPTSTPIIDEPINESVEDMISELKDESKPIFDLIYGLSTIVVDNPDYDDSGIIDEYEINNWFNNLVPLLIAFFLFVMYLGLKKENRGDKP